MPYFNNMSHVTKHPGGYENKKVYVDNDTSHVTNHLGGYEKKVVYLDNWEKKSMYPGSYTQTPKPGDDVLFTREQVMGIFKKHDKNNDKFLSKEELKAAFQELGSKFPAYRVWRGTHYADADGDGFISEMELNDLIKYAFEIGYKIH